MSKEGLYEMFPYRHSTAIFISGIDSSGHKMASKDKETLMSLHCDLLNNNKVQPQPTDLQT